MSQALASAAQMFQPIGLAFTLIYFYGNLARTIRASWILNIVMGALLGFAAVVSMAQPITISDGFIIDGRLVFVAIAVALFGWTAGLTTAGITLLTRIGLGGSGMLLGSMTILWTIGIALGWRFLIRPRLSGFRGLLALAGLTVTHMWIGLFLPPHLIGRYFLDTGPYIVSVHFIGILVLGLLLTRERLLIVEAESLRNAATTDPLTQSLNRRSARQLVDRMNDGPRERNGRAVLLLDIDHFKKINDTHGHPVGDEILTSMTRRLRNCLRGGDSICRLGGDEFSVILPNTSQAIAQEVAERCRATISDQPFTAGDTVLSVSTSIGLFWTGEAIDFEDHIAHADAALYKAKRSGRNRVSTVSQTENGEGYGMRRDEEAEARQARVA